MLLSDDHLRDSMSTTEVIRHLANNGTTDIASDVISTETTEVWRTLMAVYLGAILFLSLTFNGTLCLLFYKKTHLLSVSNCFVLNLIHLEYSGTWCQVQGFLFTVLVVTQQLALLTISLDRNYAIMNSLRYPNVFTQSLCLGLVFLSWLFGIVISIPPVLDSGLGQYKFHKNHFICSLDWSYNTNYLVVFSVLSFGLPIFAQSICYVRIFLAAVGHNKRSAKVTPWVSQTNTRTNIESEQSSSSTEYSEAANGSMECKAVRTILIIGAAFLICWVPYFVECFETMNGAITDSNFSAAAICFLFSSGILNPLIYAYMNRITRREIGRFVCGSSSQRDSDDFVSTSMSTHTSVWDIQNRNRPRSLAATNDMATIHEHPEESVVQLDDKNPSVQIPTPVKETRSPGGKSVKQCEKIFVKTESARTLNSTEIIVEPMQEGCDVVKQKSVEQNTSNTVENAKKISDKIQDNSHWSVIKSEKFKEERRRSSYSKEQADGYFSKGKRRRKRDCGSFLYFEHEAEIRSRKTRPDRISVDHVQSISVGKFPNL
ncbi:GP161-like protein, partial [Mya arenaria]